MWRKLFRCSHAATKDPSKNGYHQMVWALLPYSARPLAPYYCMWPPRVRAVESPEEELGVPRKGGGPCVKGHAKLHGNVGVPPYPKICSRRYQLFTKVA